MHRSIKSSTCHLVRHWQANVLLTMLTLVLGSGNALAAVDDLTALSLEQLMDVSVSSASRFEQKVSKIASSVTVISREEIQQHGWRTLAQGVPGRLLRLSFRGDNTASPLLSRLSRDLGLDLSILQGSVGRIKDTPYGQLVVAAEGAAAGLDGLASALDAAGVDYEVLRP